MGKGTTIFLLICMPYGQKSIRSRGLVVRAGTQATSLRQPDTSTERIIKGNK
jgi:hypothetical protein